MHSWKRTAVKNMSDSQTQLFENTASLSLSLYIDFYKEL
jgi:hypothetical protein